MQNSYTVINASAGSGKTYALVQKVLMICLKYPNQPHVISNILALTFTNKAANEMKERILSWLGAFIKDDFETNEDLKNIQAAFLEQGLKLTLEDLHERSKKLLDYILHNYSNLNISTIDKFNSRLVRSFTYELGLAKNFNLEIDAEPFLIEAVDKMLDQIGEKESVSDSFMDYVNYSLDNNERINLNQNLYTAAKEFVKDIHYEQLKNNKDFDTANYEIKKTEIRKQLRDHKDRMRDLVQHSIDLFKNQGIEVEDFAQGKNGLGGFFLKVQDFINKKRDAFPFPTTSEDSAVEKFLKGASAKGKSKEAIILELVQPLLEKRIEIIQLYIATQKLEKILAALLPLKVNKDIQEELKIIEEENDLVLLSKFNVLINENLKNEPSAFIYEKVGTQFSHFFFDEFQDTSELQWQNFVPLRDHSVSSENTSFTLVGDPKQSIYRFRGGESQLMLNIINKTENTPKNADLIILQNNWRSAQNIVHFNNELYEFLSHSVQPEHQNIFGKDAQQIAKSRIKGRVKVHLIENQTNEEFYIDSSEKIQKDIQEALNNGFSFSDITILCRGNTDIFNYSQKLANLKVDYKGEETYIKTISDKGLTLELSDTLMALTAFLKWTANPRNTPHLVLMMYYLKRLGRIHILDFTADMKDLLAIKDFDETIHFLQNKYGIVLQQDNYPKFNLYNYIEYYLNEFAVENKETDFLLNFLEMLYNFTQNTAANVKDFIKYWDEEASQQSVLASENIDAVQLMTIHKSKGLEFPIVMIPMMNKSRDNEFTSWFKMDDDILTSVHINQFNKNLELYDEEIQGFNADNSYKNFIDRVCLQYVATTRPVEQLFLYLQKESKSSNYLEILNFVKTKNPDNLDEFDIYETDPDSLQKKIFKKESIAKTKSVKAFERKNFEHSSIKVATPSKNYQVRNEKVRTGIFVHELLSKINTEKDVDYVLENYLLSGKITLDEKLEIEKGLHEIIQKNSEFFDENWEVINERDIMISENDESKIYRPDRILQQNDQYMIIDFKTGDPNKKNDDQIKMYQQILEKLGKTVVKTQLIYL